MRKVLILAAALALSAGPALAQQAQDVAAPQQPAVTQLAPAQAQPAEAPVKAAPSIHVSTDEIRRQVQLAEEQRTGEKQIGGQSFWYLVAAIALGVLIAILIAD
jgi:xanthine dehydrogenase molybdopterin-binding subunit B